MSDKKPEKAASGKQQLTAEEIKRLEIEEMLSQTDSQSESKSSDIILDIINEKLSLTEYKQHNPTSNRFIGFLKPYEVTFPKDYYREMHRLLGLSTTDEGLRTHPSSVARNTNDIIYRRFPDNTLHVLQKLNPRGVNGERPNKHFQRLNDEAEWMLKQFLHEAITMMKEYADWDSFYSAFCIKYQIPYQLRIKL
jgi:hypothetical protein